MKAVLVLDEMPEKCGDCILKRGNLSGMWYNCTASHDERVWELDKADWCPLRKMPAHFDVEFNPREKGLDRISYMIGWNDCLDEMGGKDDKTCAD